MTKIRERDTREAPSPGTPRPPAPGSDRKVKCRWSFDPIFDCIYDTGPDDYCYVVCGYRRAKMKEHYDSLNGSKTK